MIENVSTQLTVFHCFAHCLLPGRAFASLYALLFLEKEAEIGGRASQGVKTLKNNAIIIMTVIILMGRAERKPDVVAFTSAQSDQCLCCSPS